jgi:hypothetical protein
VTQILKQTEKIISSSVGKANGSTSHLRSKWNFFTFNPHWNIHWETFLRHKIKFLEKN